MSRIADFKAQMANGGTRSNQFRVQINTPAGINIDRNVGIMCSAASLPAVNIDPVTIMYRGSPVNFAGERTFEPWTVTIINDMKGNINDLRNAFESWQGIMHAYEGSNGVTLASSYQADMSVFQLDRNENVLKSYRFFDAFPISVGQIGLSYDNSSIQTFDVTFMYNYYVPDLTTAVVATPQDL